MFSNLNKPAFGASTANTSFGFGSAAGANPFGGQNQLFGKPAGSSFGGAAPAFGQTAGSSLFPNTQQQSGGLFQSNAPSFGAPATGQTAFGAPATSQPAFGGNVFGGAQQQAAGSSLFGGAAFGQQNKPAGFGFGPQQGQSSLFGQTQPTAQQTGSPFQASTSTNLFGAGAFGAAQQQAGTVVKFQPLTSTDTMQKSGVTTTINTKHHCITCMKEYEGKSLEELRWEDYQANRKGPQQQGFGAAPFNAVNSSVPMFGQPQENKPVFGQGAGGGFGSSFGMQPQASTSQNIFGKPTAFGGAATTANAFGFGTNTLSSSSPFSKPFGAPTTQPLFGAGAQPTSNFGGGMFSQQQNIMAAIMEGIQQTRQIAMIPAKANVMSGSMEGIEPTCEILEVPTKFNTSLFGKPQTTAAFGAGTPSFSFSAQPASQTTNLFSTSKPSTAFPAFGQTNTAAPVFGQQQQQQPAFGQTAQPAFGASTFGKPATGGFGQPAQPAFGTGLGVQQGSLFSSMSKPAGNLFSSSTGAGGFFTTNTLQPQSNLLAPQSQPQPIPLPSDKQHEDYKMAMHISDQFGQLIQLTRDKSNDANRKADTSRITKSDDIEKLLIRPTSPPAVNSLKGKMVASTYQKKSIFDGLGEEMAISSASLIKPRKRLILKDKDKDVTPASSTMTIGEEPTTEKVSAASNTVQYSKDDEVVPPAKPVKHVAFALQKEVSNKELQKASPETSKTKEKETQINQPEPVKSSKKLLLLATDDLELGESPRSTSTNEDYSTPRSDMTDTPLPVVNLQRPQYYTIPSLDILEKLKDEEGRCYVKGFTVGRVGYGNVCFPEVMDVSNLNLDEIVHIRHREVVVYPDDARKPPRGQGLNRHAQVTFDGVYPVVNGQTMKKVDGPLVLYFTENLREVCERKGMRFLEYRPETGSFVFEVDHFSKYGLDNEDISVDTNKYRNKRMEELQRQCEVERRGIDAEVDGIDYNDDVINGLGGVSVPDIEMTDIITSLSSDSRAKEVYLIKSALNFDHFTELEKSFGMPESAAPAPSATALQAPVASTSLLRIAPTTAEPKKPIIDLTLVQAEIFEVKAFFDIPLLPPVSLTDFSVFMGKTAKIGWMRGSTFLKPHWQFNRESYFSLTDILTTPFKLQQAAAETKPISVNSVEFIEKSMNIFQNECECVMDGGIPTFKLTYPQKFVKRQILLAFELMRFGGDKESVYFRDVWGLCYALFGPMRNSQSKKMWCFNEWLMEVVSGAVEESQRAVENSSKDDILDLIYINLTGRRIEEAAELALSHGFPQLSVLLTTFTVPKAKQHLATQIKDWKKSGALKHINRKLIKIYLLLAGMPICGETNICDDLEWVRSFAVHVWYVGSSAKSLGTAVELYEHAYRELGYAPMPTPAHYKGGLSNPPYDVLYHLILLFTKKNAVLTAVLNPASYTDNMSDYRLSWFLLQVLTALKVGVISDYARNYICVSFASQLEQLDLWHYAIFVLLFMTNKTAKKTHIEGILYRNLPDDILEPENIELKNFLVKQLLLPTVWLHSVLADKCRFSGDATGEFYNSLYCGRFNAAQTVLIDKILPTLVVNKQYETSLQVLGKLEPHANFIENYRYRTGLLLAILKLIKTIKCDQSETVEQQMQYRDALQVVARGIKSFEVRNPEQGLCIAEISKCCALLLYTIFKKFVKPTKVELVNLNTIFQSMLQMPPDYKATELELLSSDILDIFHSYTHSDS